jgi:hypothetical protein
MYKPRNHLKPDNLRDISMWGMLMSRRRGPAGRFRALYIGISGHRPVRIRHAGRSGTKGPD